MVAKQVSQLPWFLLMLLGLALPPSAGASPWRSDWSFAAPPTLAHAWNGRAALAYADNGDFLVLASSPSIVEDQFLRMGADGSLRWIVNLTSGLGASVSPSTLLPNDDGGGFAAEGEFGRGYVARVGADGTLAWVLEISARSLAQVRSDRLAVADCGHLSLLDTDAGTVLWQRSFDSARSDCSDGGVVSDETTNVYVTYRQETLLNGVDIHVAKHDLAGQLLWDQVVPDTAGAEPVGVGDNLLYVRSNAELRALRVGDGSLAWAVPLSYGDRVLLAGSASEVVVVAAESVRRLAASDGMPRWSAPITQAGESANVGDAILVETAAGLLKLDADDGAILWTQALPQADAGGHPLSYFGFGLSGSNSVLAVAKPASAAKLPPFLQRLDLALGTLQGNPALPAIDQGIYGTSVLEESGDVIGAGLSWAGELPELQLRRVDSADGGLQWQTSVPIVLGEVPLPSWMRMRTDAKPLMSAEGASTLVAVVMNTTEFLPDNAGLAWVAAFDNATGALRWSVLLRDLYQAETAALKPIADADGNVYFSVANRVHSSGCLSGHDCGVLTLYKLAAADGAVLWIESQHPTVPYGYFPPQPFQVLGSDVLQFGDVDGPLNDVSILRRSGVDGSTLWTSDALGADGIDAVHPAADGDLIVSGSGWAKLDASTGATVWSANCPCGKTDQILLADGNLLSVGQFRLGPTEWLPSVRLLRNDGSGTFEQWQLESSVTPFQRVNALQLLQNSAGEVWLRMHRFSEDRKAGLYLLAPFDVATGTLGGQQVMSRRQTDIGRDSLYGDFLSAPADGSLLLDTWAARGLSATTSGNIQLDTRIIAQGDIQVAVDTEQAPALPGDTLGFHVTVSYQGDAPVIGAGLDLYSPWAGGLVDLDCAVVSASDCTLDARTGNLHASFDLLPGAVVSISGRMKVLADSAGAATLTAVAYGPVGLAEPDTRNNFAGSVANERLFADGFE